MPTTTSKYSVSKVTVVTVMLFLVLLMFNSVRNCEVWCRKKTTLWLYLQEQTSQPQLVYIVVMTCLLDFYTVT